MEEAISISQLKLAYSLSGNECFVVNQENPIDKKIETRFTTLEQLMAYIKGEIKETLDEVMPVGSIRSYAGTVSAVDAIPGWLLCNGSFVSRVKYKKLFDVIKNLYGTGNSDSFRIPDLRGRVIMGFCNGGSTFIPNFGNWNSNQKINLGKNAEVNGVFYHKLTAPELPRHSHMNNHTHKYFNIAHLSPSYIASYYETNARGGDILAFAPSELAQKIIDQSKVGSPFTPDVSAYAGETSEALGQTSPAGESMPHNNMQPYVTTNYLIKY
jgi:microcystin-dependent protein